MARPKQTAAYCRGGKAPWKWSRHRPVASACSQEPTTEDAKDVAKASIRLTVEDIDAFMKAAGNTKRSASVSAGGVQWQLSVETSAADDGTADIDLGCSLRAVHENGAWSRWITADFFVCGSFDWHKVGDVREKMIGSEPLPGSAGEPRLTSDQEIRDYVDSFADRKNRSVSFRVDFACWKDSFQTKGDFDDVVFNVQGRPMHANKGYITYLSPVLRAMLSSNFKEGQSNRVPLTQTSAEDFVTFMRAISPAREPVTDSTVLTLYAMADVYDVGFLRRDCEKYLMTTKGIDAIDKILVAQRFNKTDLITRLVGSLSRADLEEIHEDDREDELSAEVNEQLREHEKNFRMTKKKN